jgi:hypothetical protein
MDVEKDVSAAAFTRKSILDAALLTSVTTQFQRRPFPFSVLNRSSQSKVFCGLSALPVAI